MNVDKHELAAITILEYIIEGFDMNNERLKLVKPSFGKDYFRELLEHIRSIQVLLFLCFFLTFDQYLPCS